MSPIVRNLHVGLLALAVFFGCGGEEKERAAFPVPLACTDLDCAAAGRDCIEATDGSGAECGSCSAGYFEAKGACEILTRCGWGEYEASAPTPTSDRLCRPLTKCPVREAELGSVPADGTSTTDRVCCHYFTQNVSIVDGEGWPEFEEPCLVVEGNVHIRGKAGQKPNLFRVMGDVTVTRYEGQDLEILDGLISVTQTLTVRSSSIVNLNGLGSLRTVETLYVEGNDELAGLAGLASLEDANIVLIWGNSSLQSLEGLDGLQTLLFIEVFANDSLADLKGLGALQEVAYLNITGNPSLQSFAGLDTLQRVTGVLQVRGNGSLRNFDGLNGLMEVRFLDVQGNSRLSNFIGLDSLRSVRDVLQVAYNDALESFDGAGAIEHIGGSLVIIHNESLSSLSGMSSLSWVGDVTISHNDMLCPAEGEALLAQLESGGEGANHRYNGTEAICDE